jgi:hypothetical protein
LFRCSLRHQATELTRGRRCALLDFFHGEKEERQRRRPAAG